MEQGPPQAPIEAGDGDASMVATSPPEGGVLAIEGEGMAVEATPAVDDPLAPATPAAADASAAAAAAPADEPSTNDEDKVAASRKSSRKSVKPKTAEEVVLADSPTPKQKAKSKKKPKKAAEKPMQPYLQYRHDVLASTREGHPELGDKELIVLISGRWKKLDKQTKLNYQEAYKKAMEKFQKSRGKSVGSSSSSKTPNTPSSSRKPKTPKYLAVISDPKPKFPNATVKRTMSLGSAAPARLPSEVVALVGKAAECFVGWLAAQATQATVSGKRKTIRVDDLYNTLKSMESTRFLRATIAATPTGNPVEGKDAGKPVVKKAPPKRSPATTPKASATKKRKLSHSATPPAAMMTPVSPPEAKDVVPEPEAPLAPPAIEKTTEEASDPIEPDVAVEIEVAPVDAADPIEAVASDPVDEAMGQAPPL